MTRLFNVEEQGQFDALFKRCVDAAIVHPGPDDPGNPSSTPPLCEAHIRRRRRLASAQIGRNQPYDRGLRTPGHAMHGIEGSEVNVLSPTTPKPLLSTETPPSTLESPASIGLPSITVSQESRPLMPPPLLPECIGMIFPWRVIWVPLHAIQSHRRYRYLTERGRYVLKFDHQGHLISLQLLPRTSAD